MDTTIRATAKRLPKSQRIRTSLWIALACLFLVGCQSNPRRIVPYQGKQHFPPRYQVPFPQRQPPRQVPTSGVASFYGEELRGKPMANGEPFNPDHLTAASWFYPFGTKIRVVHQNRSVIVVITDRGPAKRLVRQGRIIDLSRAAFQTLAHPNAGLIPVRLYRISAGD